MKTVGEGETRPKEELRPVVVYADALKVPIVRNKEKKTIIKELIHAMIPTCLPLSVHS
ncbi:hypothetical protein ACFLYF_01290 [Chloroflexota bacterium]